MSLLHTAGHPILVCVEPEPGASELLHEALALAVALARPLYVLSLVPEARGPAGLRVVRDELGGLAAKAREALPDLPVIVRVETIASHAERRIVAYANECSARLIVVGSRRRRTKQHIHAPGVTAALLSVVDVPLLIVPLPSKDRRLA